MKKYTLSLLAGVAALGFASAGHAADLIVDTPTPGVVNVSGWDGAYIGFEAGYGWGTSHWENIYGTYEGGPDEVFLGDVTDFDINGFLGGVVAGVDKQIGSIVVGLAGSLDLSGISGSGTCFGNTSSYTATCSADLLWLGDLTGRIGLGVTDTVLLYAKGGVAFGGFEYNVGDFNFDSPEYDPTSETKIGGVIGLGVEAKLSDTLSAKLEGDWYGFGSRKTAFSQDVDSEAESTPFSTDIDESIFVIKAGLNMRF